MKKILIIILSAILLLNFIFLCSCSKTMSSNEKLKVVATLFPQYDFAKVIGGDKAEIKLLLKPGIDSHSYEPTGNDMMEIADSDMFIYTGALMEHWAETILNSISGSDLYIVDVSSGIEVEHSVHEHTEEQEHFDEYAHSVYDPHIWTDPLNAKIMVKTILDSFIAKDPKNEVYYAENATKLLNELDSLNNDFVSFFETCKNKKLIFGGKFAMYYFAKRYNLEYEAAYDNCSVQNEPSPGKIAELIDIIKSENINAVFYEELIIPTVAQTIANETGATPLLLHSCHNISTDDFNNGETYVSLMRKNLENLKIGM